LAAASSDAVIGWSAGRLVKEELDRVQVPGRNGVQCSSVSRMPGENFWYWPYNAVDLAGEVDLRLGALQPLRGVVDRLL